MKKIVLNIALIAFSFSTIAQTIGIGTTTPAKAAVLDVSSTTKGILLPRLTSAAMHQVASLDDGLLAYCTDCTPKGYYYLSEHDSLINLSTGKSTKIIATVTTTANTDKVWGIGTTTPSKAAVLDVSSTTKGILLPRLTSAAMHQVASLDDGLLAYCTDCTPKGYYYLSEHDSLINVTTGKSTGIKIPSFYLDVNGVTVKARQGVTVGTKDKLTVNGATKEYTLVNKAELVRMVNANEDVSKVVTTGITDMGYLFYIGFFSYSDFNQDISSWDVSSVTNMFGMFVNAHKFNQNIGKWDVSRVIDMSNMFYGAKVFNQAISSWDVSKVTNMNNMFNSAKAFDKDIGSWDVSKVIDMSWMFSNTQAFDKDIGSWDVSEVTNMSYMFRIAKAFDKDIGSWKVSKVTNMSNMFRDAIAFNQAIDSWNVSNVTTMLAMFYGATAFNQDLGSWTADNVTKCADFSKSATSWALAKPNFANCAP